MASQGSANPRLVHNDNYAEHGAGEDDVDYGELVGTGLGNCSGQATSGHTLSVAKE